jgi:hypothetical protein
MIWTLLIGSFTLAQSVLRELRPRSPESQYQQSGAQDDSMFLHGGFSFRMAWQAHF